MDPANHPTKYWHLLSNGRVQCDVCPQECKLNEGQRGVCFVRMRENNQMVLTTYGKSSGFCVDPIEKKPLNHFLPGSSVLSFGTVGCNLLCKFCQNYDISSARETEKLAITGLPADIAKKARELGCKSVAFTYNEPTIFMEYAIDVAKECHKLDIQTVAVTNGYICEEPRKEFYNYIDAANVDLKGFSDLFYKKITGSALQPVLDTLIYLKHSTNVWFEITTLLIPGENDSDEQLTSEINWIADNLGKDVPLHFTAFYPAWKMLDRPPTTLQALIHVRDLALQKGIRYVYVGNVYYPEGSNTYCHNCKKAVIARDGYNILEYSLDENSNCSHCGTKCSGVFEKRANHWAGKRIPVKF